MQGSLPADGLDLYREKETVAATRRLRQARILLIDCGQLSGYWFSGG